MRTTYDQFDNFDGEFDAGAYRDQDRDAGRGIGRQRYREQPSDEPIHPPEPHDLTLGMTALAGIFLAVVLVCAIFFGFGYSTGRTLHGSKSGAAKPAPVAESSGSSAQSNAAGDDASGSPTTPPLAAVQPVAKPSAGAPMSDTGSQAVSRDQAAAKAEPVDEPAGFPPSAPQTFAPAARTAPASIAVDAPANALPAATGGVMVQIAAVMRQTDADMLANALRTNGYAAIVRSEPQDKFLHVQVGPFATRDQAKAMRTRLQGDGYNAFLKP